MAYTWFEYAFDSTEKGLSLLRFYPTAGLTTDQLSARVGSAQMGVLGIQSGFLLDGLVPGDNGSALDDDTLIEIITPTFEDLSLSNDGGIESIASVLARYGTQFLVVTLKGLGGDTLGIPAEDAENTVHNAILPAYQSTARGDEIIRGYYEVRLTGTPKIYIPDYALIPSGTHYAVYLKCFATVDGQFNSASHDAKLCVAEYNPGDGDWSFLEATEDNPDISPYYSDFTIVRLGTIAVSEGTYGGYLSFPMAGIATRLKPSLEFLETDTGETSKKYYVSYFLRDEYSELDNLGEHLVSKLNDWDAIRKVAEQMGEINLTQQYEE